MLEYKQLDYGCIILCPDADVNALKLTLKSINNHSLLPCIAVIPKGIKRERIDELKKMCEVVRGKSTYTSLINAGLKKLKQEWGFILLSGSIVKSNVWLKYSKFIKSKTDILYPVSRIDENGSVAFKTSFMDCSLNGLLINTSMMKEVGEMPEKGDLEESKLYWAYSAIKHGCKLRGILGNRIV